MKNRLSAHVGRFDYNERWRVRGESILKIYYRELRSLRFYARELVPVFNMRTVSLTQEKLKGIYDVARLIMNSAAVMKVISGGRENVTLLAAAESYLSLIELERRLKEAFSQSLPTSFRRRLFRWRRCSTRKGRIRWG